MLKPSRPLQLQTKIARINTKRAAMSIGPLSLVPALVLLNTPGELDAVAASVLVAVTEAAIACPEVPIVEEVTVAGFVAADADAEVVFVDACVRNPLLITSCTP